MNARRMGLGFTLACLALSAGYLASDRASAAGTDTRVAQYGTQDQRTGDRSQRAQSDQGQRRLRRGGGWHRSATVPQGAVVAVTIGNNISTERSNVGDTWHGVTQQAVVVNGRVVIAAGTSVSGTVSQVLPPQHGQNATLGLSLETVIRDGRQLALPGSMEPIVAGSARARNLGIVVGGAAAGAVVGHAVGKSTKGTVIGALLGGLAGGAYTHSKGGYNIELKPPFTVEFSLDQPVAFNL